MLRLDQFGVIHAIMKRPHNWAGLNDNWPLTISTKILNLIHRSKYEYCHTNDAQSEFIILLIAVGKPANP